MYKIFNMGRYEFFFSLIFLFMTACSDSDNGSEKSNVIDTSFKAGLNTRDDNSLENKNISEELNHHEEISDKQESDVQEEDSPGDTIVQEDDVEISGSDKAELEISENDNGNKENIVENESQESVSIPENQSNVQSVSNDIVDSSDSVGASDNTSNVETSASSFSPNSESNVVLEQKMDSGNKPAFFAYNDRKNKKDPEENIFQKKGEQNFLERQKEKERGENKNNEVFESTQRSEHKRTISFDSRYIPLKYQQQDIRGLMTFGTEIISARGAVLEKMNKSSDSTTTRKMRYIGMELILGGWMHISYSLSLHEQAHGSRFAAMGFKYKFNDKTKSFFPYYVNNLIKFKRNGDTSISGVSFLTKNNINLASSNKQELNIIVSGAGVNAEMAYAEHVQKQIYWKGGDISMGVGIIAGKIAMPVYNLSEPGGNDDSDDLKSMEKSYNKLGIKVNSDDMAQGGLLSLLLSASTWRYFWSVNNYIETGDTSMTALEYRGIRIPDMSCYATSRGLSMKVDTGYRISNNWLINLGVEHVYQGKSATEYTIGCRHTMPVLAGLSLDAFVITGYGKGYGVQAELQLNKVVSAFVGGNYDEFKSLNGERNIVSLKTGNSYWSCYGGLRLHY